LNEEIAKVFPPRHDAGIREWVEALLLAAIIAWGGMRTFFIQPFQIPTGSMQPTLYGVVYAPDCHTDTPLLQRLTDSLIHGEWPREENAPPARAVVDYLAWNLFGKTGFTARCKFSGDHIFVDKISYHFRKPQRGDVVVFDTKNIMDMPIENRGKFYIKRLIGIGGDLIQIQPPHVLVNGTVLHSRPAFERIYSEQNGYSGYINVPMRRGARYLTTPNQQYLVPRDQLLPLGDNSPNSLDGRFWGSFPQTDLIGRALVVYWPFSRRFGPVE
jgi:signal peptidase I